MAAQHAPAQLTTEGRITSTAIELFGAQGYAATTMEQIRRTAGVSNGSLYHLFPHKAALAAQLFTDGMRQCQVGVLDAIGRARSAEQGVRDVVGWQARWVDRNDALARLVYDDLPDDVIIAASPTLERSARDYVRTTTHWLHGHATSGTIIDCPFAVSHALWLGPTQEYCRHWLRGRARLRPRHVADDLATGAWKALAR